MLRARSPANTLLLSALILSGVFLMWYGLPLNRWWLAFLELLRDLGHWALLIYAAVYIVSTLIMIPLAPLAIGAGYLFGLWPSFAVTLPAATIGAVLAFFVSRLLLAATFQRVMRRYPVMAATEDSIVEEGWLIVFLLRLSPVIPSHLLNYLCGITEIPTRHYVIATFCGKAPLIFLLSYIGAVTAESLEQTPSGESWQLWLYTAGLLFTALALWRVVRLARQKLQRRGIEHD